MKISYGITVHNESEELNKLLEVLVLNIDGDDEIVICDDFSNKETREVIDHWELHSPDNMLIKHYTRKLNGNFAEHKNSVIENSVGDYIFHIDADEYPHEILLQQLKQISFLESFPFPFPLPFFLKFDPNFSNRLYASVSPAASASASRTFK